MIQVVQPQDSILQILLKAHPEVEMISSPSEAEILQFKNGDWERIIFMSGQSATIQGLVELIDNNPMVCADQFSLPTPTATLTTIALGPLVRAGLILTDPAIHLAAPPEEPQDILNQIEILGYQGGATIGIEEADFTNVLVANVMVEIPKLDDLNDIDALFDEAYSRSFYIRRFDEDDWDTKLVHQKPWAAYRLRLTPGETNDLLTIQVMADKNGKVGAAQVVHAFNVMCGFEETLGIPETLPTA